MTNGEILTIALEQSAIDCNCAPEDFLSGESRVTLSRTDPRARRYLPLPLACDLVSYGHGIVAQTSRELAGVVGDYISRCPVEHAFEKPSLHILDELLGEHGLKVCFMAEYFLPDMDALGELQCGYRLRVRARRILQGCICPSGAMPCAKSGRSWTSWPWGPLTATD